VFKGGAGVFAEFDPSAGADLVLVLIRLRQEHVSIVDAETGAPVLETLVLAVEGDHGPMGLLERPSNGYNEAP
jgi:hypothetical protein